ncbi:MAG: hypothetical protein LRY53_04400 [Burkholderiaceae bacterium]|nr:hypothetical protein [Burkholderiaceae bacterium]MCD8517254.1 hypothetical protein [Burkholderiaceae bacterium]MCD8537789.1 hypothetical protein [Burkholderiaceae bacterium]MCD8564884.1 hypothetical protein [Burkholderiaceae bacterium]
MNNAVNQTLGLLSVLMAIWFGATAHAQSSAVATDLSLYIVQHCASMSKGGRCNLSFVQTPTGMTASGDVTQTCSPGWLAHVTAERGTVEKGGVNRGQAVVCGHTEPANALRALFVSCNEQTLGICRDANHVNVQWAYWSGDDAALKRLPMDSALQIEQLPQAQQCASVVPLVESVSCSPEAAVLLRQTGLR